ncbi:MAG: ROK family transcriptional regulator [Acidimicrobiia bacterium]|nr:ROK family transcriptional regulator [Acidimicrobiia bacterium]
MDLRDLGRSNRRQILRCILKSGGLSRSDIARETGLAHSTVTEITYQLVQRGILSTREIRRSGARGRPSIVLSLNPRESLVVVADYSDLAAMAHLADPAGEILETRSLALPRSPTLKQYVAAEARLVASVARGRWDKVQGVTIVGPGVVDPQSGRLLQNSHFGWGPGSFVKPFSRFGKQTFLQNGSRLRAMAENWYGAAQDLENFLFFHLGQGIGGAIVLDGLLVAGPSHGAGEFGHVMADPKGPSCSCGGKGCLEAVASIPAIVRQLAAEECPDFAAAWNLYEAGNRSARAVFRKACLLIARSIFNAVVSVGPTTVVVGGEMVEASNGGILALVDESLREHRSFFEKISLRRCRLPENRSQVAGAVLHALQELDIERPRTP